MKTVRMIRDFDYRPKLGVVIVFKFGLEYKRVPEAAARAIVAAEAGVIADENDQPAA